MTLTPEQYNALLMSRESNQVIVRGNLLIEHNGEWRDYVPDGCVAVWRGEPIELEKGAE